MKKYLFFLLAALTFVTCNDDDENEKGVRVTSISESELSDNVKEAFNERRNFCFTDSNYHVITSVEYLEKVWKGESELIGADFFDEYSVILGLVEAPHSGCSIKKTDLRDMGTNYRLDVYINDSGSGFLSMYWCYYWAVYPKLSSKPVVINLLNKNGTPYTCPQEQYDESVMYEDL